MLTAVVTFSGTTFDVALSGATLVTAEEGSEAEGPESDLNPIAPELKEVVWGFGAFVVLALAMRLFLFRKVRDGMTSRYGRIEGDLQSAEESTASARADVAEYEARLTSVRAEAQQKVEAARATLEAERTERLTVVNAGIAERRAEAAAEVEVARAAAMGDVESAVADVVGNAASLALQADGSTAVSDDVVRRAVRSAMGAEVSS